jgi:hypothetical protein
MVKKHMKNKNNKINMRGGNYSQQEYDQLTNLGFSQYQIELFQNLNVPFNEVIHYANQIEENFQGNSDDFAEQVTNQIYNQHVSNFQQNQNNDYDSQGSLHLSDLDVSQDSNDGYTTNEDFTQGEGGKRTKKSRTRKMKGKKNKKSKTKKNKRIKKTKKMKGGQEDIIKEGSLRLYKDENPQF